jgi:CheY-like chemotaxis protein
MATGKRLCILVTENHEDSLTALARFLELSGHTVHRARTAAEARDLADSHRCDLLISEIALPDGSGLELMRDLRQRHGLKGIAVSAYLGKQGVRDALAAGFGRHLAKPLSYDQMLAAIEELTR